MAAHDPSIRTPPPELEGIATLAADPIAAAAGAHALVIATEWPLFKSVPVEDLIAHLQPGAVVCDPNRLLASTVGKDARVRYLTVGSPRS